LTSALALLATYLAVPAFLELLQRGGAVRANHQQQQVPVGGGFLFVWMGSLAAALAGQLGPGRQLATGPGAAGMPVILFTAAALGYSLLGLFDDLVGTRKQTGLLGHGRALLQGHLTSGAVKALAGGIFGFVLAVYRLPVKGLGAAPTEAGLFRSAVDGLLIAASANTLNLFDLLLWFPPPPAVESMQDPVIVNHLGEGDTFSQEVKQDEKGKEHKPERQSQGIAGG
jgi:UDP-GlcNAc:undecaprenyl-phosphate GlcNAc-1-phosphate transferase